MAPSTILLADDDLVTLRLLTATLHHEGYRVVTAMDAMQAVMVAHRSAPDAILLDVMMPGGSGLEVLKRLKASSDTQQIPVIVMSSSPDVTLPAQTVALGAESFLPKPVNPVQLNELLRSLLIGPPGTPPAPSAGPPAPG
ncbi:MAG: response regulator [Gemmatimonadota bacterium]